MVNDKANEANRQKQEADEDRTPEKIEKDGFTAEELGEASAYDGTQEMMQQMLNQNPAGAGGAAASEQTIDDRQKKPQHQSGESDLSKKQLK